ncbi:hypothetical protein HAX54_025862 [Datura stramonium]|uniref:Uncharacterized protein n=1 Tax=Datura stramonium TaxID=4076 RepID=A0ABS8V2W8_DATST|nr:hypothetical protein [Datura stramonium]
MTAPTEATTDRDADTAETATNEHETKGSPRAEPKIRGQQRLGVRNGNGVSAEQYQNRCLTTLAPPSLSLNKDLSTMDRSIFRLRAARRDGGEEWFRGLEGGERWNYLLRNV